ncbi:MAG TPA: tetratricopeptide repeat protein [Rhabdaerophilum sp.]|nr:tetratricopeptide repeat protein [Rhabdaerophilum sp.]
MQRRSRFYTLPTMAAFAAGIAWAGLALAGDIAPGVSVKQRAFDAPINEQPYFGFAQKTDAQKAADAKFIEAITVRGGMSREQGGAEVADAGWQFIAQRKDWATAAKRFNQAWLLDPARSDIAHGFALVVSERFNNLDYAIELFEAAARLKHPLVALPVDHARVLLRGGRADEAVRLMEEAVRQKPDYIELHVGLAAVYLNTRQRQRACEVIGKAPPTNNPDIKREISRVQHDAKCF